MQWNLKNSAFFIFSLLFLHPFHQQPTLIRMSFDDQAVRILEEAEKLKLGCQHEESISLLEGLLLNDPANIAALEELADNELSLERYDRAEKAAKQAVALDPQSYMGHYILGFVASVRKEWVLAEPALKKANELKPSNAEILRCLGWVLFCKGEKVQGIVTLERALNLDSESTLCLCDLGMCYMEAKNMNKAYSLFERVLDFEPENERAKDCLEKIRRIRGIEQKAI